MIRAALRKLYNNILSPNAVSVLGPKQYGCLLAAFIFHLPAIIASRDLRPLDKVMSGKTSHFKYRGKRLSLDLRYCDESVQDGSFAFGSVREILIRDCYLRHHDTSLYKNARTVVDVGANRGIFSSLMAATADLVVCVEAQPHFVPIIQRNMRINGFKNYAIERATVGSGGDIGGTGSNTLSMCELFDRHHLERVNLLKMDIEGSEFSLFESTKWLDRVEAISMEVHHAHGDPALIASALLASGFGLVLADANLRLLVNPRFASFMFASRRPAS